MRLISAALCAILVSACGKDTSNNGSNNTSGSNNSQNMTTQSNNGSNNANGMTANNPQNVATNNSNNGTNNVTTLGPITVDNWTEALIRTYCEAAFDCPGTDFYLFDGLRYYLNTFGSKAACIAGADELAAAFGEQDLLASVDSGRLQFDDSVAEACLAAYRAQSCGEDYDLMACDGLFTGVVPDDDNCAFSDECANPESVCNPIAGACFGACGPELCGMARCAANEVCDANDTCVAAKAIGETCQAGECVENATCNYDAMTMEGTCVGDGSVATGDYCWVDSVCASDHRCDLTTETCQPLAGAQEACVLGGCVDPLVCNYDFTTSSGVCVMEGSVAENQTCVDSSVCAAGLYCDITDDTCKPADKPDGAECTFSTECQSGLCNYLFDGGTCAQPNSVAEGGPCGLNEVCTDGLSCDIFGTETCKPLGGMGDPCNDGRQTFIPIACAPTLACLNVDQTSGAGVCGAPRGLDAQCQDFSQCAAPYACVGARCQEKQANGASCANAVDCASYACDETTSVCEPNTACMVP